MPDPPPTHRKRKAKGNRPIRQSKEETPRRLIQLAIDFPKKKHDSKFTFKAIGMEPKTPSARPPARSSAGAGGQRRAISIGHKRAHRGHHLCLNWLDVADSEACDSFRWPPPLPPVASALRPFGVSVLWLAYFVAQGKRSALLGSRAPEMASSDSAREKSLAPPSARDALDALTSEERRVASAHRPGEGTEGGRCVPRCSCRARRSCEPPPTVCQAICGTMQSGRASCSESSPATLPRTQPGRKRQGSRKELRPPWRLGPRAHSNTTRASPISRESPLEPTSAPSLQTSKTRSI